MAPKKRAWPLMCLVVLGFRQLCFVQGWPVPIKDNILTSKIQRCVRERRRPVSINKDTRGVPVDKDVRMITSKIKNAPTAGELLDFVGTVVDTPIFNYIHAAAAYTKLGNFQKKGQVGPKEVNSNALVRLDERLEGMLLRKEVGTQGLANILWAIASLVSDIPALRKIVPGLVEQIPGKVGDMIPQALSNLFWAAAQLQDDAPKVLNIVPVLVAQMVLDASKMDPQGLSNSLWAAGKLHGVAPEVVKAVPALAAQACLKAGGMKPQELSNSLWAAANLQDAAPEVVKIVPALAAQIPLKTGGMNPQDLSNSLWALKDFADASPAVAKAVQALVEKVPSKITSMNGQELSNTAEALVFLAESFPVDKQQDIIAAAAAQFKRFLPRLKGKELMLDVPMVVWACRRSNVKDQQLFIAVANRFSSHDMVASLPPWGLCALNLGIIHADKVIVLSFDLCNVVGAFLRKTFQCATVLFLS